MDVSNGLCNLSCKPPQAVLGWHTVLTPGAIGSEVKGLCSSDVLCHCRAPAIATMCDVPSSYAATSDFVVLLALLPSFSPTAAVGSSGVRGRGE